jgi:putative membrane protein
MNRIFHTLAAGVLAVASALSFAQAGAPNDAQIAGIVVAANTVDINAGEVARSAGHKKEVKDFAQRMITDHTGVNKQASALVKKLNVTPEDSDTSKALKDDGATNIASLKKLKGNAFDKAYIDHEVTYHQTVLDAIDKTLLPNAKNAELKALIEKVRPAIDAHLQHAKQIQASLK